MNTTAGGNKYPLLSIIVVVFNMRREAPRTLFTLSPEYQNLDPELYEVIVVDNGSDPPLGVATVRSISKDFKYVYLEPGNPSPAHALNLGARQAKAPLLGFMIDGARMLSPGILQYAIRASRCYEQPIISTLGFHLGFKPQPEALHKGYNQEEEDKLLATVDWRKHGYDLFRISTFAGSSRRGWFAPICESNCVFLSRDSFEALGGFDEAFGSPGGGMANHDFYRRACHLPGSQLVVVLGEGSFHQFHGGVAAGKPARNRLRMKLLSLWNRVFRNGRATDPLEAEYRQIRGQRFQADWVPCDFIGQLPPSLHPNMRESIRSLDKVRVPPNGSRRPARRQRSILILGMHRSGTSMLTGSLQEAGLALGDVVTRAAHNHKGNRECRDMMSMQEDLLVCNGGAWDNPPETVRWQLNHKARRNQFISQFTSEELWGFKDPRTLLTLDGWLDVLPDAEFVGIFRHPARVAESLNRRNNMSVEKALKLWQIYNQHLLSLHQERAFPLLEFHDDAETLQECLQQLVAELDLPVHERRLAFFDEGLRQTSPIEMDVPDDVLELYQQLQERAVGKRARCKREEAA